MAESTVDDQLANLAALTDSALADLDVDDLLTEMLDRVRSALNSDTAAVLLRDPGSDQLIARAAWGLEDEVRQGVHVPIGSGFAGRIAATREPVRLDRVDSSTVSNPILWEAGVKVMLGVPLVSGEQVIGVLHVGRLVENAFTQEDVNLLQIAADRVATALQARQLAIEAAAARLLERGLQPTRLPRVAGLELAARYVPAEDRAVGGDWYDSFLLPSGALWLVVGDVGGHGLDAAVIMGRVKSALRSYALLDLGPSRTVELTDRKVQHFEIGVMVTVVCAVAMPPYERFEICSAGHLPPVIAAGVGPAELVALKVGPPLGALADARHEASTVELAPESVLLLYTDGLVERRDEDIDRGLERLRAAVSPDHPERVCQTVMRHLVGNRQADDDIALLAARRTRVLP